MRVLISAGEVEVEAELYPTPTGRKVWEALPIESVAHRWGDEIYFSAGVDAELEEDARAEQEVGNICYWCEGRAVAIFFGRTPASTSHKPVAVEPVNLIGRLTGDAGILRKVKEGERIRMSRLP